MNWMAIHFIMAIVVAYRTYEEYEKTQKVNGKYLVTCLTLVLVGIYNALS